MNEHVSTKKIVHVFKNGRSRAVRIPKEFDFEGDEVEMQKQADGSIILTAMKPQNLVDYLKTAEPWTGEDFIQDDSDLLPLDDFEL